MNINNLLKLCSVADAEHIRHCDCQDDKIDKMLIKKTEEIAKELKEEYGIVDNKLLVRRIRKARNDIIQELGASNQVNKVTCSNEKKEIKALLLKFKEGGYDISDPSYYLIMKSLVTQVINAYKIQRLTANKEPVVSVTDKVGNVTDSVNPIYNLGMKINELIINASEKLYKLKHGTKITNDVNVNNKPIPINELFSDLKVLDISHKDKED